ncbi:copper resistance protein CopC [Xanthobacter sp. V4C-4]|uniref:copper resistance CopC family protein n=1 Tax=Xanthobacter cornucopiae TaxID=3119924 RepID=UPI0037270C75
MSTPLRLPAVALGLLALSAGGAQAQCAFDQSSPNANDQLRVAEPAVSIDFMLEFDLQQVRVVDAQAVEWPTDWTPAAKEVRRTRFRITKPLPPGKYLIEWNGYLKRHQHADGGSIPFTVLAQDGAPPAGPAPEPRADLVPRSGPDSPYRALLGAGAPPADR